MIVGAAACAWAGEDAEEPTIFIPAVGGPLIAVGGGRRVVGEWELLLAVVTLFWRKPPVAPAGGMDDDIFRCKFWWVGQVFYLYLCSQSCLNVDLLNPPRNSGVSFLFCADCEV